MNEEVSRDTRDMKMAAAYKKLNSKGIFVDPEVINNEIDKHLFQKIPNNMNQDEENELMRSSDETFEVSISMAKTAILMANTNKAPGLDQINENFFKVMLNGGKGDEVGKNKFLKNFTNYANKVLNGKLTNHEATI